MKHKRAVLLIGVLAVLTAFLAAVHLGTRDAVPQGTLKIETPEQTVSLVLSELALSEVKGTVVNGKGDEKSINAQGILLSALLEQMQIINYQEAVIEADDAYSATVTAEEIDEPGKVYLIAQEDGGVQMIVFGDSNSKRHVSNVVCLQIR